MSTIRQSLEIIHGADPTDPLDRGKLDFVAASAPGPVARAAANILETVAPVPPRPNPYRRPFKLAAWSETARPLDAAEVALIQRYSERADTLTESDIETLVELYKHTEPGAARDLIREALAPTFARIEAAEKADEKAESRWRLQHTPRHHARIEPAYLDGIEDALIEELATEVSDLPDGDDIAKIRARKILEDGYSDAATQWKERRTMLSEAAAGREVPPAA